MCSKFRSYVQLNFFIVLKSLATVGCPKSCYLSCGLFYLFISSPPAVVFTYSSNNIIIQVLHIPRDRMRLRQLNLGSLSSAVVLDDIQQNTVLHLPHFPRLMQSESSPSCGTLGWWQLRTLMSSADSHHQAKGYTPSWTYYQPKDSRPSRYVQWSISDACFFMSIWKKYSLWGLPCKNGSCLEWWVA